MVVIKGRTVRRISTKAGSVPPYFNTELTPTEALDQVEGLTLRDCIDYFSAKAIEEHRLYTHEVVHERIRLHLATIPKGSTLSTRELVTAITNDVEDKKLRAHVASKAMKIAKETGRYATHDGRAFKSFGTKCVSWRWHGQKTEGTE